MGSDGTETQRGGMGIGREGTETAEPGAGTEMAEPGARRGRGTGMAPTDRPDDGEAPNFDKTVGEDGRGDGMVSCLPNRFSESSVGLFKTRNVDERAAGLTDGWGS